MWTTPSSRNERLSKSFKIKETQHFKDQVVHVVFIYMTDSLISGFITMQFSGTFQLVATHRCLQGEHYSLHYTIISSAILFIL